MTASQPLLTAENLWKSYNSGRLGRSTKGIQALRGVTLTVEAGSCVGIIGESGCGKSTLARIVAGIERPDRGRVLLQGRDVGARRRRVREDQRLIQMVFQDPDTSLNPRHLVGWSVAEGLRAHPSLLPKARWTDRVHELLEQVGLDARHASAFPRELSGGQRQRVGIARALALEPRVLVCDEPVASLDVSIQAQVLNLLKSLQTELQIALIYISHEMSTLGYIADEVAVMYLGKVVEQGASDDILQGPRHPYTQLLVSGMRPLYPWRTPTVPWSDGTFGEMPDPSNPPAGCAFRDRCQVAVEECAVHDPELIGGPDWAVACHVAADNVSSGRRSVKT